MNPNDTVIVIAEHSKKMNEILIRDTHTLAGDNLESIDRITPTRYWSLKGKKRFFHPKYYWWLLVRVRDWWRWGRHSEEILNE